MGRSEVMQVQTINVREGFRILVARKTLINCHKNHKPFILKGPFKQQVLNINFC